MSARRELLQVSSSSSSSDDEGDQHFRLVKKQVVSNKNSKAKHIASKSATRILPSRASAKRSTDSPNPRQGKRGKKNQQVPSEQISSEGEEQEDDLIEKTEDLSKSSFSKNKAQSKEKHVTFQQATDTLPSGVVSSKRLSKKKKQDINEEAVVEDKSLKKDEQTVKKKAVVEDKSLKKDEKTVKKNLFKRLWSEDDECTILKGLINYTEKNDTVPTSVDTTSFYDVIRNSLQMDATKNQLTSKISKLKKRYLKTLMNGKKGDESEVYKLSKHIWWTDGNLKLKNMDMVKDLSASRVVPSHVRGESSSQKKKPVYGSHLKLGVKNGEMEEKWKKLKVNEIEVYLQKIAFLHDLAALQLEELKSN